MDKTNLATLNRIPGTLLYPQIYTHTKTPTKLKKSSHWKIYWKMRSAKKKNTWAKYIEIFLITEIT